MRAPETKPWGFLELLDGHTGPDTMTPEQAVEHALLGETDLPALEKLSVGGRSGVLTRRELEVADLVARGLTNRRIAAELSLSERTVDNHVANILKKLGLRSRKEVTYWVIEQRQPRIGKD